MDTQGDDMSSNEDARPLLTLLSLATQRQREILVKALSARGFDDIALPGARLLAALREGESSIVSLAATTGTTKQFCAREVQKLVQGAYVQAVVSAVDRRVSLVSLAQRGRALLDASGSAKKELDAAIRKQLGDAGARALRGLLVRLVDDVPSVDETTPRAAPVRTLSKGTRRRRA